ncbi:DUF2333 family protein [Halochromatium sp.]
MNAEMTSESPDTGEQSAPPDAAQDNKQGDKQGRGLGGKLLIVVILAVLVIGGLGMYWSVQPRPFSVTDNLAEMVGEGAIAGDDRPHSAVPGTAVVSTAIRVARTLLHKPGGFMHNDMTPPGVLLDNMPNWEYGVLTELRDSARALRNDFSRSQTQSIEFDSLQKADSDFNFSADAWFLPASEEMYNDGIAMLEEYLAALKSGNAQFFARADNLRAYMQVVEKRLGSYGQRLAASVGDPELTAAFDSATKQTLKDELGAAVPQPVTEATSWTQIDDVFYEARGYSWALLHMMKALQLDFRQVLKQKNAEVSMEQIIRDLEMAVVRKYSPMVLNGHGFGVLANHSLVLASYLGRANAAVIDMRVLLERG